jgi:DNA polymerase-3 subunit alpha
MGEADIVRRGFAKKTGTDQFIPIIKNGGYLNGNKNHYIDGYIKTMKNKYGISEAKSEEDIVAFIQVIEDASSYLFSLNHSQPYSFMGYACAYLRYYYPTEFITCCLNINKDNSDKTTAVTDYAKKVGVEIVPIKFGHSRADYACDAVNKKIYKGVASIKNLNNAVSEELYTLSQSRVYNNFIDLLIDIAEKTSCNSRQLDILIKLDYFSEFGEINELLWKTSLFDKLYVKGKGFKSNIKQSKLGLDYQFIEQYCTEFKPAEVKEVNVDAMQTVLSEHESKLEEFNNMLAQCIRHKKDGTENGINYEKLFKLTEMPEDIKQRFATKTSEAEFKGLDGYKLLTNIQYNGNIMSVKEKIKYQQEYLSYIDYTDPNINQNYIVVTNLNTNYSPKFTAYRLKDGKTVNLKVRKNKKGDYNVKNSFKDTPFEDGDILQMLRCKAEPKAKFIDGGWKRDYTDKEWWLYEYKVIGEN